MNPARKKLKIGITIDVYDAVNGGVISTRRIVQRLRERGHEVYVFASGEEPGDPYFISLPEFYVPLAKGIMQKLKMPLARPRDAVMRPVFEKMDIIHSMFPFWLGYKSLHLARELGKPIVSTFHIQVEHIFKNIHFETDYLIRKGYQLLINQLYNRSDFLFCPSQFAYEEILRYGLKTPAMVLSNGVASTFVPKPVARPPEWRDRFILVSVGRLSPEKSHKTIIEAIGRSKFKDRIQLLIFGEGPQYGNLMKQAQTLTHPLQIDTVNTEQLIDFYNLADLYVHASEIETEGMAPLEASACGTPLLISDSPKSASGQFVLDPQFFFKHGDAADLAQKIDYWLERPEALREWGRRYAQAAEKYRIERVVDQMEDKYYKLCANKKEKEIAGPSDATTPHTINAGINAPKVL